MFHVHRNDVDVHEKVAIEIGKLIGDSLEKALTFWRNTRNEVDYSPYPVFPDPLEQLASKAVDAATSCLAEIENFLKKRGAKL